MQKFKIYPPGYMHLDVTQVYTKQKKLHLFVALDRTAKYCKPSYNKDQTSQTAVEFLQQLIESYPCKITKILTDNGLQFTHKSGINKVNQFTSLCHTQGITHRLTKPNHSWTNGQIKRI